MFLLWNLIADLVESADQRECDQQQITDFYAKASSTFPRLACLMQLYFNASAILEEMKETTVFSEGDNNEMVINEDFIKGAEIIIRNRYHIHDKTYIPSNDSNQTNSYPIVIVEKPAVIAAWQWYSHHLEVATKLFTIDYGFTSKAMKTNSSSPKCRLTLKQMIMYVNYHIFPLSTITDKHPETGQT